MSRPGRNPAQESRSSTAFAAVQKAVLRGVLPTRAFAAQEKLIEAASGDARVLEAVAALQGSIATMGGRITPALSRRHRPAP